MKKKTLDEHRDYLHQIVRLQLWFLWQWKHSHADEDLASILRNRIDIYRKTDLNPGGVNPGTCYWDDERWLQLEESLIHIYKAHADDVDAFEQLAFERVRPHLDARCQRDFEERPYVLDYQCGSLKYDKPPLEHPRRVFVHIANALTPRSIFEDDTYLPQCLLDLMDKSSEEYGASELQTVTWLNAHSLWLRLFPEQWQQHMSQPLEDVQWHFGYWGQFINARGTFNRKLGARMRQQGTFPFMPRRSWCTFSSLRRHLQQQVLC